MYRCCTGHAAKCSIRLLCMLLISVGSAVVACPKPFVQRSAVAQCRQRRVSLACWDAVEIFSWLVALLMMYVSCTAVAHCHFIGMLCILRHVHASQFLLTFCTADAVQLLYGAVAAVGVHVVGMLLNTGSVHWHHTVRFILGVDWAKFPLKGELCW